MPDTGSPAEPSLEELGFPGPNKGVQAECRQHRTPGLEGGWLSSLLLFC